MVKKCTRCGQCCREAKICDMRKWFLGDAHIPVTGCELLIEMGDGTTICEGILNALDKNSKTNWCSKTREWITNTFITRGCELDK